MQKTLLVLVFFLITSSAKMLAQGVTQPPDTSLTAKGIDEYKNKRYAIAYNYLLSDTAFHYPIGQYYLGLIFYYGKAVPENNEEAFKWFKKAANNGYANAQNFIGVLYAKGQGVIKNDTAAFYWYQKAANNNSFLAQNNLASYYEKGRAVKQNDSLALFWYQKAADNGSAGAQNSLGLIYGTGTGVIKNDTIAFQWYKKSAQQNYVIAQYNLANYYKNGRGVKQNDSLAVFWYQKAADSRDADAQNSLGFMYEKGRGVAQSDSIAHIWYSLAQINGNERAKNNLANLEDKQIRQNPKLYLKPEYYKGLNAENKKEVRKMIFPCFEFTGQVSISLTLEDLLPPSSRIPESPATIKKLEELKQKFKADPTNFTYAMQLGSGYNELNMKDEALLYLNAADSLGTLNLAKNPNDSTQLYMLAFLQITRKNFTKGLELSNLYSSKYGLSNDVNIVKIFCYIALGDRDNLIQLSDSLIAKKPDEAINYLFVEMMNILPGSMNKVDSAHVKDTDVDKLFDIHRITQAAKTYPNNFKIQFMYTALRQMALTMKLSEVGSFSKQDNIELSKVKLFYENAIKQNNMPSNYIFYKFLGNLTAVQSKYGDAIKYTKKAVEIKKHELSTMFSPKGDIYDQLISLYVMKENMKQAQHVLEEKIKQLAQIHPDATDYISLAKFQVKKNELDSAEKNLNKALQLNPAASNALLGLSVINTIKGNDAKALEYLDKTPETERETAEFFTAKGITQLLLGEYKFAYNCLNKAKELNKDFDAPAKLLNQYFLPSTNSQK